MDDSFPEPRPEDIRGPSRAQDVYWITLQKAELREQRLIDENAQLIREVRELDRLSAQKTEELTRIRESRLRDTTLSAIFMCLASITGSVWVGEARDGGQSRLFVILGFVTIIFFLLAIAIALTGTIGRFTNTK